MDTLTPLYTSLIEYVKQAQVCYIEAIHCAKQKDFKTADKKMKEGSIIFIKGHRIHASLVKQFSDSKQPVNLMLVHSEDRLMAATSFKIIAEECMDVYRSIYKK